MHKGGLLVEEKEVMLTETIGRNIQRFRKAKGWTQEQLAEKVGRATATMSHIETGTHTLGVKLLVTMADLLSVSVDELVRPENTTSHLKTISSLLTTQSDGALAKLEPFIQLWVAQYGESVLPKEKGQTNDPKDKEIKR